MAQNSEFQPEEQIKSPADDLPEGLDFTPDHLYMQVKPERCNYLGNRFWGNSLSVKSVSAEEIESSGLCPTELIWLYEAAEVLKINNPRYEEMKGVIEHNKAVFASMAVKTMRAKNCFVICSKASGLPYPFNNGFLIYTVEKKAFAAADAFNNHFHNNNCYVRRIKPEEFDRICQGWQAAGFNVYQIDAKNPRFRLSDLVMIRKDTALLNPSLCQKIMAFVLMVRTGRNDVFSKAEEIEKWQSEILSMAKDSVFYALRCDGLLFDLCGKLMEGVYRPIRYDDICPVGVWTDSWALWEFVRTKENPEQLWREAETVTFPKLCEMIRRYPFAYTGIMINPDQLTYYIPKDSFLGTDGQNAG